LVAGRRVGCLKGACRALVAAPDVISLWKRLDVEVGDRTELGCGAIRHSWREVSPDMYCRVYCRVACHTFGDAVCTLPAARGAAAAHWGVSSSTGYGPWASTATVYPIPAARCPLTAPKWAQVASGCCPACCAGPLHPRGSLAVAAHSSSTPRESVHGSAVPGSHPASAVQATAHCILPFVAAS